MVHLAPLSDNIQSISLPLRPAHFIYVPNHNYSILSPNLAIIDLNVKTY